MAKPQTQFFQGTATSPLARPPEEAPEEPTGDEISREGLRVKIEPIPGVTDKGLLSRNGFYFQCPPLDEYSIEYAHSHTDYETIRKGQFSRRGGRQLRACSFDTLVVDYAHWTLINNPNWTIEDFNAKLIKICESGTPFLLTLAHAMPPRGYDNWEETLAGPELQMEATLRTLKVAEKAGEGDARYLNVDFVEYREPFATARALGKPLKGKEFPATVLLYRDGHAKDKKTGQTIARPPAQPVTLKRLAKHYYKKPAEWQFIAGYKRNKITNWGGDDALIDYFVNVRHARNWPVKITIPKPPGSGGNLNRPELDF